MQWNTRRTNRHSVIQRQSKTTGTTQSNKAQSGRIQTKIYVLPRSSFPSSSTHWAPDIIMSDPRGTNFRPTENKQQNITSTITKYIRFVRNSSGNKEVPSLSRAGESKARSHTKISLATEDSNRTLYYRLKYTNINYVRAIIFTRSKRHTQNLYYSKKTYEIPTFECSRRRNHGRLVLISTTVTNGRRLGHSPRHNVRQTHPTSWLNTSDR